MEAHQNHALIYQELARGTIRVLDLLPGQDDDTINVNLQVVSVENSGPYKALSYTWGSTTSGLQRIACNGHDFMATANLFTALKRFRDPEQTQRMWVDAICINQSSIQERTQQVGLMVEIYANAEEVLIWIGEHDGSSDVELLFRVAESRYGYATSKTRIEMPPGDHPLLLFSPDTESVQAVAAVQKKTPGSEAHGLTLRDFGLGHLENDARFLLVGSRLSQCVADGERAPILLRPSFDPEQVMRAVEQQSLAFDEFLKEALKPAELTLSDQDTFEVHHSLYEAMNKPYWSRAWIIQEILVSSNSTIVYGEHRIGFEVFSAVYGFYRRRELDIKNFMLDDLKCFHTLEVRERMHRFQIPLNPPNDHHETMSLLGFDRTEDGIKKMRRTTLAGLLNTYGKQNATDARDHIFSLVGALKHFSKVDDEIEWCTHAVDYSVDRQTVFLEAAKHIVVTCRPLYVAGDERVCFHVLEFFTFHSDARLPTWVPDWTSGPSSLSKPAPLSLVRHVSPLASPAGLIPYKPHIEGSSIFLPAHIIDEVDFASEILDYSVEMYKEVDLYQMVTDNELGQAYDSVDARFEAFWRTIVADHYPGTGSEGEYESYEHQWREPIRALSEEELLRDILKRDLAAENGILETEALRGILQQERDPAWHGPPGHIALPKRRFVTTKRGYFGLGHPCIDRGDLVVLLAGHRCPWYLRRRAEHYQVIGPAWVQGLMYKTDVYYRDGWKDGDITTIELQ
ncbi:hypothetical protein H2203_006813 [Taxawa tesnikishii (nom. ined.)]|nr:hypothetical protein H2203_006813 [Dothideales sp. JES 119]